MLKKFSSSLRAIDQTLLDRMGGAQSVAKRKRFTAVRDVTALGGDAFLIIAGLMTAALHAYLNGALAAVKLFFFLALGRALGWTLKAIFKRSRPHDPVPGAETFTSSFPSIHTLNAFCVFTALGFVMSQGEAMVAVVTGAILSALVGATRLIFRVHWPTDVVAGYLLGLIYSSAAMSFL